jgi:hypothetical protein
MGRTRISCYEPYGSNSCISRSPVDRAVPHMRTYTIFGIGPNFFFVLCNNQVRTRRYGSGHALVV